MKKNCPMLLLAAIALAGCASVGIGNAPMGTGPSYLESTSDGVPNAAALSHRIWTPGLDEGYVPQGLTNAGGYLFVSSYKPSPDLKSGTGPCRVFRIEMASGKAAGQFDIPAGSCTHSGGLAHVGNGKLFLADTRQLFLIDVEKALASGTSAGASQSVKIAGELRGSYATFDGKDTWIGSWTKDQPKAHMFRLDPHLFDRYDGQTVKQERAVESIPVPLEAQGAAFDQAGNLWVSASNGKWGKLYRLDRSGKVQAQYQMVAGLEDLTVDASGRLWGLSESGTRKYLHWETRFPYVFQIDTGKLQWRGSRELTFARPASAAWDAPHTQALCFPSAATRAEASDTWVAAIAAFPFQPSGVPTMKLRNIALTLALVATGTAFAATTTETTVTKETPNGTVTKHIVRVNPNHRHLVKRTVVYHEPVVRHHYRHVRHVRHPAIVVHQG